MAGSGGVLAAASAPGSGDGRTSPGKKGRSRPKSRGAGRAGEKDGQSHEEEAQLEALPVELPGVVQVIERKRKGKGSTLVSYLGRKSKNAVKKVTSEQLNKSSFLFCHTGFMVC